jgi:hypothetical protein
VIVGEAARSSVRCAVPVALARPKLSTLTMPSCGDRDVRWLEVSMDDPLRVRGFERLCGASDDDQRLAIGPRAIRRSRLAPSTSTSTRNWVLRRGRRPLVDPDAVGCEPRQNSIPGEARTNVKVSHCFVFRGALELLLDNSACSRGAVSSACIALSAVTMAFATNSVAASPRRGVAPDESP